MHKANSVSLPLPRDCYFILLEGGQSLNAEGNYVDVARS